MLYVYNYKMTIKHRGRHSQCSIKLLGEAILTMGGWKGYIE